MGIGGRGQHALGHVALLVDSIKFFQLLVDFIAAFFELVHALFHFHQFLAHLTPAGQHLLQHLMAFMDYLTVFVDGRLLRLGHGVFNVIEHIGHHGIAGGWDGGHRINGTYPGIGGRWYLGGGVVILFHMHQMLVETLVHGGEFGKVTINDLLHAFELALDEAFGRILALFEQHLAITLLQATLGL